MADTSYIPANAQGYIRSELENIYGQKFTTMKLEVSPGGTRKFAAVSDDLSIVAEIKTSGGKTSTGKNPSGKINSAIVKLYYLSLLNIPKKLLILTNSEFYEIFTKKIDGFLVPGIEIRLMELPEWMENEIRKIQAEASKEVGG